ncbi:hypothetical protein ACJEMY_25420, partial [Escherichia coli]
IARAWRVIDRRIRYRQWLGGNLLRQHGDAAIASTWAPASATLGDGHCAGCAGGTYVRRCVEAGGRVLSDVQPLAERGWRPKRASVSRP